MATRLGRVIWLEAWTLLVGIDWCLTVPTKAAAQVRTVVVERVHLVSMITDSVLADQTVLVRDDKIAAVGRRGSIQIPKTAQRIDGRNGYLIPGLADMHAHPYDTTGFPSYLAHGVTTLLTLNGSGETLRWRDAVRDGRLLGPTIYSSGPSVDGDPPVNPRFASAGTPSDGRCTALWQARSGFDAIKVYNLIGRDAFVGLTDAAQRAGITLVGHSPQSAGVEGSLRAGQTMVAHAEEFFREPVDERRMDEMVRAVVAVGATVTPNISPFREYVNSVKDLAAVLANPEMRYLSPAAYSEKIPSQNRSRRPNPEEFAARIRRSIEQFAQFTKKLQDAGVSLLAGTDTETFGYPGQSLHSELDELVAAGLTPYQALAAATVRAGEYIARHVRPEDRFGRIAPGYRADLVLLADNPLKGLRNLGRIQGVMVQGRWFPSARLRTLRESTVARLSAMRRSVLAVDSLMEAGVYGEAVTRLRELRSKYPGPPVLAEIVLRNYGRRVAERDPANALALRKHNADMYPLRHATHRDLAEAYLAVGDSTAAGAEYHQALAINPCDSFTRDRLRKLEASYANLTFEPRGRYELTFSAEQTAPFPAPRGEVALEITGEAGRYKGKLARPTTAETAVQEVTAGANLLWVLARPADDRPIELRLTVHESKVTGAWVQGPGRHWKVTGHKVAP